MNRAGGMLAIEWVASGGRRRNSEDRAYPDIITENVTLGKAILAGISTRELCRAGDCQQSMQSVVVSIHNHRPLGRCVLTTFQRGVTVSCARYSRIELPAHAILLTNRN